MALFRRSGNPHALEIAMTGVKLGDRLLQIGCADTPLVAALSAKAGMSGRACVLATGEDESARVTRAAERAGVSRRFLQRMVARLGIKPSEVGANPRDFDGDDE